MRNRRSFLQLVGASVLTAPFAQEAPADERVPPSAVPAPPRSPPSEQLLYSTVRLHNSIGNITNSGTGFFFEFLKGTTSSCPAIVTNRHVAESLSTCYFAFHERKADNQPDILSQIPVTIEDFATKFIPHPTEDLAIFPIAPTASTLAKSGHPPYYVSLDSKLIPTESVLNGLNPLEQVVTIGFPGTFFDDTHNIPLFHSGNTATPPYLYFKSSSLDEDGKTTRHNKKTFLVDFTTSPGASGSPVFIYNPNGYSDRNGSMFFGAQRILLIGVVFGVASQEIKGNIVINNAPVQITGTEHLIVPANVGACLLSSAILDFDNVLIGLGVVPPDGYVVPPR